MGEKPSDAAEQPADRRSGKPVPKIPISTAADEGPAPAFFSPHAAVLAVESAPVLGAEPTPAPALDPGSQADGPGRASPVRRSRVRRHRVLIGDARHNGRYVRATWHA